MRNRLRILPDMNSISLPYGHSFIDRAVISAKRCGRAAYASAVEARVAHENANTDAMNRTEYLAWSRKYSELCDTESQLLELLRS